MSDDISAHEYELHRTELQCVTCRIMKLQFPQNMFNYSPVMFGYPQMMFHCSKTNFSCSLNEVALLKVCCSTSCGRS